MSQHDHTVAQRHLQVGLIAPPWVAVPPPAYGGTELVVDALARGLTRAGCEVVLFGTGDSTCPVPTRWLYREALGTVAEQAAEMPHVVRAYRELAGVDVIHDHTISGPLRASAPRGHPPVVTTLHGALIPELRGLYVAAADRVHIVAISQAQRRSAPELRVAAVIHHGIDVDAVQPGPGDGGYALFLGRMSPDKGADRAIRIARAAGLPIVLAAKMWEPEERRYFAEAVEPLLGPDATYVGQVAGEAKLDLLRGAVALVNPIQWPEPFGLVMVEALACGTPVLAFPHGAAPEIVDHGRTGYLCEDEADMSARLATIERIDRARCRDAAVARFSVDRMVADHLALYRRIVGGTAALATVAEPEPSPVVDLTRPGGDTLAPRTGHLPPQRVS